MSFRARGRALGALVLGIVLLASAGAARANPRPLPYTYIYETLPQGEAEVELYTDLTPLRALNPNGAPAWYLAPQFQAEIEYGLTDRLELGLYLTAAPAQSSASISNARAPDRRFATATKRARRLAERFSEPAFD
jgi:hypothetical protein